MAEQIYHLNERNELEPMSEENFAREDTLQELVAKYPGLLSGEQMNPDSPRRFILVGREHGIADIVGGSNRWSLDHLLIDQDAIPTLVEAKRSSNPQIRREIVGQMMDYAAHATQTWNVGSIRRVFEERLEAAGQYPDSLLAQLLQSEAEPDADAFWQQVETNLRAARLRLLFVSDGIPDELTRVVEFLNEQMPGIEVLAVEIKQFKGCTGTTLVPRVIGRTSEAIAATDRSIGTRSATNREEFLSQLEELGFRQHGERLLSIADSHANGVLEWGSVGVSVRGRSKLWRQPLTVAWLYPIPGRNFWSGTKDFTFGAGNASPDFFELLPGDLRQVLENWAKQFDEFRENGASSVSAPGLAAWAISHQNAAANIDLLCERLDRVLRDLAALQPEEG